MNNKLAIWPAPKNISALSTTRLGGYSVSPYDSNNLALHVGDNPIQVEKNRQQLIEALHLPAEPVWLNQTHSTHCIIAEQDNSRDADAAISSSSTHPLVILTADCLPIVLCNSQGTEIAAIHAGWRGLFNGIIKNTLKKMSSAPDELIAWIGPAISQQHYEVGEEVFLSFTQNHPETLSCFKSVGEKWLADLPKMAELIMNSLGIKSVHQCGFCTFELKNELYSYRRAEKTGRIATLIWFNT